MLEQLIEQLERKAGSASLVLTRRRVRDWTAILFRDDEDAEHVIYLTAAGNTAGDAVHNLLADPRVATGL